MDKPTDFVERYTSEFGPAGVDVASVPQNAKPEDLLFGKNPPPVEAEPQDDFWKWDDAKQEFFVEVDNNGRAERFAGKTRTEAARNLAEGKKAANQAIAEVKNQKPRQPDTKLPYDPIQRKQPRKLSPQELVQIQELSQTDPVRAQEMLFEARTGYTMDDVAQSVTVSEQTRREVYAAQVAQDFCSAHQKDFSPTPSNMRLMEAWLNERKLPVTRNNLEIAFFELSEKLAKPVENVPRETKEFLPPPPPVSPPARPAPGAVPSGQAGLSREDVATVQTGSLADARSVIQNAMRAARGGR